jgi:hypothetical protein
MSCAAKASRGFKVVYAMKKLRIVILRFGTS